MTQQYLRQCSLLVGDASGNGLELSELRVTFRTQQGDTQTPNNATIRVYNLSRETENRVQKEFTRVVLRAGYEGNFGVIFDGTITFIRKGRENPTDTFLDIFAADGDQAYNFGVVNTTLAAGSTASDRLQVADQAFGEHGVVSGYKTGTSDAPLPRGQVLYGMARDVYRNEADNLNASWSIQYGQVQMVARDGYIPGQAIVLNASSGLIGLPTQTQGGIEVRCLLNPNIRVSGRIKLDNSSIQLLPFKQNINAQAQQQAFAPKLDADGFYKVWVVEHRGDTRGQDWYSDLICTSIDPSAVVPPSLLQRTADPG